MSLADTFRRFAAVISAHVNPTEIEHLADELETFEQRLADAEKTITEHAAHIAEQLAAKAAPVLSLVAPAQPSQEAGSAADPAPAVAPAPAPAPTDA